MSWQNVVLTLMLRWRVKRRSDAPPQVAEARRMALKMATKPRLPPGWRIRAATEPFAGEWIERDGGAAAKMTMKPGVPPGLRVRTAPPPGNGRETASTARTLLYLHGGGYYFCSPATHRVITVGLAAGAEARTFVPDYRLAPEHRFPAAVEDALRAYRGLLAAGTPAHRIVLGGDSAGGGLALALLLSLRDAGDPLPAGAALFSPWTDLAATGDSILRNDHSDPMFHGRRIAEGARLYLGDAQPTDPLASPLYADLARLPPLFIQASDSEVLLDDSTRLADKARKAGVAVEFRAWRKLPHVWQFFAPFLPEGRAALQETAQFIRRVVP
jgi:monoterpene epsilon-lactone hydrolase